MSLWTRITDALGALRSGESLADVFSHLRTPPERSAAFGIAVIALGAKMAKADGLVTRDEVSAFREVFTIPPEEEKNAARVFDMARTDVAGFEQYAKKIADLFGADSPTLSDLLEGLFFIAMADGTYHPAEDEYLARVSEIFGISDRKFRCLRSRFVPDAVPDPYSVLGVEPNASLAEVRGAWRAEVRASHPDQLAGRGLPHEAVKLAEKHMIAVNRAWEEIQQERA